MSAAGGDGGGSGGGRDGRRRKKEAKEKQSKFKVLMLGNNGWTMTMGFELSPNTFILFLRAVRTRTWRGGVADLEVWYSGILRNAYFSTLLSFRCANAHDTDIGYCREGFSLV